MLGYTLGANSIPVSIHTYLLLNHPGYGYNAIQNSLMSDPTLSTSIITDHKTIGVIETKQKSTKECNDRSVGAEDFRLTLWNENYLWNSVTVPSYVVI